MANKDKRELCEITNLFADPKYYRQAWKAVGNAIAMRPASKPLPIVDKDGNETTNSQLETYGYRQLCNDLASLGKDVREPTQLEMILECQMIKARTDTAAATFIRDTLGAKPIDESKIDVQQNNPYEQLSDEELELLANLREQKKKLGATHVALVPEGHSVDPSTGDTTTLVSASYETRECEQMPVHLSEDEAFVSLQTTYCTPQEANDAQSDTTHP